uniref:C2H2-type domain-containing protein n=1 Tax=Panagrellus redivivus TaxID=6233 RepID=A0A7E4WCE8_PANRE
MAFCSFVDRSCIADQSSTFESPNMTGQMIVEDVVATLGPKVVDDIYEKLKLCFADKSVRLTGKNVADQEVNINLDMRTVIEKMSRNQLSLMPMNANQKVVKKAVEGDLPVPAPVGVPKTAQNSTSDLPPMSKSDVAIGTPRDGDPIRLISSLPAMALMDSPPASVESTLSEHSILQGSPVPDADTTPASTNPTNDEDFFQNLQGYFSIMNAMQAIAPLPLPPTAADNTNILANFFTLFNATANAAENPQPDPPAADTEASPTRLPWSRRGRRIPCEFCSERFSSREEARIHSETVHIELFQYTCMEENCKKRYKARQGLATHCSKTGHLMPPPNLPSYYSGSR